MEPIDIKYVIGARNGENVVVGVFTRKAVGGVDARFQQVGQLIVRRDQIEGFQKTTQAVGCGLEGQHRGGRVFWEGQLF